MLGDFAGKLVSHVCRERSVIAAQVAPYGDVQSFFRRDSPIDAFYGLNNFNVLVCLWFAVANTFDIVFGLAFYRDQLKLLTTYIHHSAFIYIMITCTTGNGLFYTVKPSAPTFQFVLIEELPTMILSLGSIFPSFRTDLGFGVSFFLLRVVYHICLLAYVYSLQIDTFVFCCFFIAVWVHLHWFYCWCKSYAKKRLLEKGSDAKAPRLEADKSK